MTPYDDIVSILSNGGVSGYSVHDIPSRILADKLGDDDDPREIILRRDIEYRQENNIDDWVINLEFHGKSIDNNFDPDKKPEMFTLNDGTKLEVIKSGSLSYYLRWYPDKMFYGAVLDKYEMADFENKSHGCGLLNININFFI